MTIKLRIRGVNCKYETSIFPGGEVHVRLPIFAEAATEAQITAHIHSSDDIMRLLVLTDALRRNNKIKELRLEMPYLPYARQDRVTGPGDSLSLKVFCDIINAQKYDRVRIWDCHSDVGLALLERVENVVPQNFLRHFENNDVFEITPGDVPVFKRDNVIFVSPDAGANKKIHSLAASFRQPYVRADKKRDTVTGEITGTVVYSDHIGHKDFLIADDICDGGRTFIELAKVLRPLTDGKIMLYVTHGIMSKGWDVFNGLISDVMIANSFKEPQNMRSLNNDTAIRFNTQFHALPQA